MVRPGRQVGRHVVFPKMACRSTLPEGFSWDALLAPPARLLPQMLVRHAAHSKQTICEGQTYASVLFAWAPKEMHVDQ